MPRTAAVLVLARRSNTTHSGSWHDGSGLVPDSAAVPGYFRVPTTVGLEPHAMTSTRRPVRWIRQLLLLGILFPPTVLVSQEPTSDRVAVEKPEGAFDRPDRLRAGSARRAGRLQAVRRPAPRRRAAADRVPPAQEGRRQGSGAEPPLPLEGRRQDLVEAEEARPARPRAVPDRAEGRHALHHRPPARQRRPQQARLHARLPAPLDRRRARPGSRSASSRKGSSRRRPTTRRATCSNWPTARCCSASITTAATGRT